MTVSLPIDAPQPGHGRASAKDNPAYQAAQKLEAAFLAEMLKSAGIGERQFASFHRQALAEEIAKNGGVGLAELFFNAMV